MEFLCLLQVMTLLQLGLLQLLLQMAHLLQRVTKLQVPLQGLQVSYSMPALELPQPGPAILCFKTCSVLPVFWAGCCLTWRFCCPGQEGSP